MNAQPRRPFLYWLHGDRIAAKLDAHHLTHGRFADHLGLSRSYWSQLVNRKRPLTPMVRTCLLGSRYLQGVPEDELWERVPATASRE